MKKKNVAIIAAGGRAKRLGKKAGKQYLVISGRPQLFYTLLAFQKNPNIDEIIVATIPKKFKVLKSLIKKHHLSKIKKIVSSGRERFFTVKNALAVLPKNTGVVLVHDGARPAVSQKIINDVIRAAAKFGAAVPGIAPADTIKTMAPNGKVKKTLNRENLRLVQTPQGFKAEIIKKAYQKLKPGALLTDDAALVEKLGYSVKMVLGDLKNIKLTYPQDLIFIKGVLEKK